METDTSASTQAATRMPPGRSGAPASKSRLRQPRETWLLYAVVGLLIIALWALVIGFSTLQKQRLLEESQRELAQLRNAVARHAEGLLRLVESDLRVMDQWLQANPQIDPLRDARFNALVDELRRASGGLIDPRMLSTSGKLYYIPAPDGQPRADVSDRSYFTEAMRDPERRLLIGDPVVSRVTGKWGIPISWRLEKPVAGIAVLFAAIELDRLMAFHEKFRVAPAGSITLVRRDGMVLSRTPFDMRVVGTSLRGRPLFTQMLQQGSGSFTTQAGLADQVARLVNYEDLQAFPVFVVVTRGEEDTLETFYARRRIVIVVSAILSTLVLFATWRLANAQRVVRSAKAAHERIAAELVAAQDASPLGLFRCDVQGALTYVNQAWRSIYGLPEPASPDDWINLVRPEIRERVQARWREAAAQAEPFAGVRRLQRKDGSTVLIALKSAAIVVDGLLVGRAGTVDDVTERAASEQALRSSEQRLRSITDRLPMRVSYVDRDERVRFLNHAHETLFGKPRESLYGLTLRELVGDAAYRAVEHHVRAALQGESVTFESEFTSHEGYRCFSASYVPQFAQDGSTPLGFVAIASDITGQKLEERRLRELSHQDSLTGMLNRSGFDKCLREAMARTRGGRSLMALMYLDMDHFKKVNDSYGHFTGDLMLQGFAGRLARTLRAHDRIARIGGDEFSVIVEGLEHEADAAKVAQNLVQAMHPPFMLETGSVQITTSIGVALWSGAAPLEPNDYLRQADELLYGAKAEGRDRFKLARLQTPEAGRI